jgi:hypothetical protein
MHRGVLLITRNRLKGRIQKNGGRKKNPPNFSDYHKSFYTAQIKSLGLITVEPKLFFL